MPRRDTQIAVLAIAILLAPTPALSAEVSDYDRFRLWNECRPARLSVEGLPNDADAIGLTKKAIEVAVRSRLRAARLYSDSGPETEWSRLYINVNVVGRSFSVAVEYGKYVRDLATKLERSSPTWSVRITGTHGRDSSYILSTVEQNTDAFIDEYLRVNEANCK